MESSKTQRPIIDRKPAKVKLETEGAIQFHILLRLAYKNIVFKKMRTMLTLAGVIIGVGSIVFLLSFGFGLQNLVSKQVIGSSSVQTIDVSSPRSKVLKLNDDLKTRIKNLDEVKQIGVSYSTAGKIKLGSSQTETVVYAADQNYINLSSLNVLAGSPIAKEGKDSVLINNLLSNTLGLKNNNEVIGKTVNVTFSITDDSGNKKSVTKDLKVSGVYKSDAQAELFISNRLVEEAGMHNATQYKVVSVNKEAVPDIRKSIEGFGFTTVSPLDTIAQINQVFSLLQYILFGFGGIGMVIAILGMFNTLTISLLERTKEIALMISLGARKQDVKRLFIVEALLFSLLGSAMGIVGAIILGVVGNFGLNSYAHHNGVTEHITIFSFPVMLFISAIFASAILGLLVVYFPAKKAASTDPIEVLHND